MTTRKSPTTETGGYTLLELMVAVTVGAVVMTAVYSVFSTAIRSERSANNALTPLRSARYAFAVLARDARNLDPLCLPTEIQCGESSCLFPVADGAGRRKWVEYEEKEGRLVKTTWTDSGEGPDRKDPLAVLIVCRELSKAVFRSTKRGKTLLSEDSMDKRNVLPGMLGLRLHFGPEASPRTTYRSSVFLEISPQLQTVAKPK
mgnify:CR=1 FL=1